MQKSFERQSIIRNEKGQATLVMALAFAAISAILIVQMSSAHQFVNTLHSRRKAYLAQQELMQELALQVKQAYDKALMRQANGRTGCGGSETKQSLEDGAYICIPSKGFCVEEESMVPGGKSKEHCLSLQRASLKLPKRPAGGSDSSSKRVKNGFTKHKSSVRIRIPKGDNLPLRECEANNPCLQLTLCPPGRKSCGPGDAVAIQTLRLGPLNKSKVERKMANNSQQQGEEAGESERETKRK